jgi:tetratricopeptide (TPR) repeat protein
MSLATLIFAVLISQMSVEAPTATQKKAAVAHSKSGIRALKARQHISAINHFTESLDNWERAELYVARATTWMKLRKFDLAVQDCEQAIEIKPELAFAHYVLGLAQIRSNNPNSALSAMKAGAKLQEGKREHWKYLHQQAVAHAALGEFSQAAQLQRQTMNLAPIEQLPLMLKHLKEYENRHAMTVSGSASAKDP